MDGYNFSGLWFEIYGNVIQHNDQLGNQKLDKNQLREVATSIFIAATRKGISRPEAEEDNFEIPEELKGIDNGNGNGSNDSNSYNSSNGLATEKQLKTIRNLLNNDLVTDKEKKRIESILAEPEVSKSTASEILTYFLGNSEKIQGEWVRISKGVLDVRKSKQPA